MSENNDSRVLSRLRSRELSAAEYNLVPGGFIVTGLCTVHPKTHTYDGDCEPPPF